MTAGYSGKPLAAKLGFKPGMTVWIHAMPDHLWAEIGMGDSLVRVESPVPGVDAAHLFVTEVEPMTNMLAMLRDRMNPAGFCWISWPKKASGVPSNVDENAIRDAILPATDWVDVKVCAVDRVWSGLKLVIRKDRR